MERVEVSLDTFALLPLARVMVYVCVRHAWLCAALSARLLKRGRICRSGKQPRITVQYRDCEAESRPEHERARQADDATPF